MPVSSIILGISRVRQQGRPREESSRGLHPDVLSQNGTVLSVPTCMAVVRNCSLSILWYITKIHRRCVPLY